MKALVYLGPRNKAIEERPCPQLIEATDVIVKVTKTTICDTDLHILKGDVPSCESGRIVGHEGVGVVEKIGTAVKVFKPGDKVLISSVTACGKCVYCLKNMFSHCSTGGFILGRHIDGTQAEYVRIPHADTSLYAIADDVDDESQVMLSYTLPAAFECGVQNGKIQPGSAVAIVGAGPVALAALLTAQLYFPAEIIVVDLDDNLLEVAKRFGATAVINSKDGSAKNTIMDITGGRGVDTAIEAVGMETAFELCQDIIAPGGTIANIGVHDTKVDLHLEKLWDKNITITTRLVDTTSIPMLISILADNKIDVKCLITHRFSFDNILDAYEVFSQSSETNALKVIINF